MNSEPPARAKICIVSEFNEIRYFAKSISASSPKRYEVTDQIERDAPNIHPVLYVPDSTQESGAFSYLTKLPKSILDDIRSAKGILLLDASGDGGRHNDTELSSLSHTLDGLEIPVKRVVIVTCNQAAIKRTSKHSVKILPYNSRLIQFSENARKRMENSGEFHSRLAAADRAFKAGGRRGKKFTFLDSTRRSEHTSLLLFLNANSLMDQGYVRPYFLRSKEERRAKGIPDVHKFFPPLETLKSDILAIQELRKKSFRKQWHVDYREDGLAKYISPFHPLPPELSEAYADSYFSMVVHPRFQSRMEHSLGEEPLRPMLGLHPFLLLGYQGQLAALRSLGFKTFSPIIDESYDAIPAAEERATAVLSLLAKFGEASLDDLDKLYRKLYPPAPPQFRTACRGVPGAISRQCGKTGARLFAGATAVKLQERWRIPSEEQRTDATVRPSSRSLPCAILHSGTHTRYWLPHIGLFNF